MPIIHFVGHDGKRRDVEAAEGASVMRAALDHDVPGIVGDCDGYLFCATCHTDSPEDWYGRLSPPSEEERTMVYCALEVRSNGRLCCQIEMSAQFDGLVVHIPEAQS